ncbi:RNA-binding RNA annealing protein [Malassezia cuniculi]|uniref:RNA-binding RNA annealing protein n=1 Tax=Malassezia cuniculi TaxID=948313 RepID=A0AAF0EY94_9BASI|nr:RNA-binding RNA annealing protein [Malassezia cuniculi]
MMTSARLTDDCCASCTIAALHTSKDLSWSLLTKQSSNLDKSLDEIISAKRAQTPRTKRAPRRNSAKASVLGSSTAAAVSKANRNQPPVVFPGRVPKGGPGSKIIVSNLPTDVTEPQVKELFATTIGPLRRVAMSYRANGQSTGVVTVEFQRAEDAGRAYTQYNNRLIDSKRPLKIEVVVDPAVAAVAPVPAAARGQPAAKAAAAAATRGRGRGRGGRARRTPRPVKTAEDLDAEMEDYTRQGAESAAAAPAQDAPAAQ